jgi:hypothetical protein
VGRAGGGPRSAGSGEEETQGWTRQALNPRARS